MRGVTSRSKTDKQGMMPSRRRCKAWRTGPIMPVLPSVVPRRRGIIAMSARLSCPPAAAALHRSCVGTPRPPQLRLALHAIYEHNCPSDHFQTRTREGSPFALVPPTWPKAIETKTDSTKQWAVASVHRMSLKATEAAVGLDRRFRTVAPPPSIAHEQVGTRVLRMLLSTARQVARPKTCHSHQVHALPLH